MNSYPPNNLRSWRERRGWSLPELVAALKASGVEVTDASISRIENRKQHPRTELLQGIVNLFGASVGDFYAEPNVVAIEKGHRRVPVLDHIQAGLFAGVNPTFREAEMTEFVPVDDEYSESTFAMRIHGDSMTPDFQEGDRVIIDPSIKPRPGDYVVAKDGVSGEATFKRYRPRGLNDAGQSFFVLEPLNPDYAPLRSDLQPIEIVGTMMEHHRLRRK